MNVLLLFTLFSDGMWVPWIDCWWKHRLTCSLDGSVRCFKGEENSYLVETNSDELAWHSLFYYRALGVMMKQNFVEKSRVVRQTGSRHQVADMHVCEMSTLDGNNVRMSITHTQLNCRIRGIVIMEVVNGNCPFLWSVGRLRNGLNTIISGDRLHFCVPNEA